MAELKRNKRIRIVLLGLVILCALLVVVEYSGLRQPATEPTTATLDGRLQQAYQVAEERVRALETTAKRLDALARQAPPDALSDNDRQRLFRFQAWLENASRQIREHSSKWNAEYEKFSDSEKMRADLVDIFIKINEEFSIQYRTMREDFLNEAHKYEFDQPQLQDRSNQARKMLAELK